MKYPGFFPRISTIYKGKIILSKNVFVISLGCSKNHCDLENMMGYLKNAGYNIVLDEYMADIAIVNTCGFIEDAKKEAIENIIETAQLKTEGVLKKLIVTGCLSQRYKDEILELFPEVDAVVGVFDFDRIVEIIESEERRVFADSDKLSDFNNMPRVQATPFYMAYLKISEGCDNCCTYCAIPKIRGRMRSREESSLIEEAKILAASGVKELIITAQDTSRYGMDLYGKPVLSPLLKELSKIDGIEWIRLHYLYPETVTDELIYEIASNEKILNYFDIPIQHINDRVLKLMNRHSDRATITDRISRIRKEIPDACIRTTVMTGFPTETEAEFNELYDFVRETGFDRLGAFAFSSEEGTGAYRMKGQVPVKTRKARRDKILLAQNELIKVKSKSEIGKEYDLLVEGYHNDYGVYFGRTYKDSVDIDGMMIIKTDENIELGDIVRTRVTDADGYDLTGEII